MGKKLPSRSRLTHEAGGLSTLAVRFLFKYFMLASLVLVTPSFKLHRVVLEVLQGESLTWMASHKHGAVMVHCSIVACALGEDQADASQIVSPV